MFTYIKTVLLELKEVKYEKKLLIVYIFKIVPVAFSTSNFLLTNKNIALNLFSNSRLYFMLLKLNF